MRLARLRWIKWQAVNPIHARSLEKLHGKHTHTQLHKSRGYCCLQINDGQVRLSRLKSLSVKITICKNKWCHQCPNIQHNANPARRDFHPDSCPLTFHLTRGLIPVPVGKGHHDIKGSQEQHEVKEGVTVSDAIPLIIYGSVNIITILKWSLISGSTIFY